MAGRQAKIITPAAYAKLLQHVGRSSTPERNTVIVLLSVKAGLRAGEIAKLTWAMVLDARGGVSERIELLDAVAKKGSGRRIPLHPDLRKALIDLRAHGEGDNGPIIRSARGGGMKPNSIVNWFVSLYAELGYAGCSSHSGRRTFITNAARAVHRAGGSLRDVQILAGHRSIDTTQRYIEGDSDAQRRLVRLI